ncbi:MAG: hypothetical protein E3K32_08215 [wastewater metagenome]|nr:hypothetical protein [Candidatus Loosdrechtia aerotolerans]
MLFSINTDVIHHRMYKTFETVGQLIIRDSSDWQRAGKIIAKPGKKYGFEGIFNFSVDYPVERRGASLYRV